MCKSTNIVNCFLPRGSASHPTSLLEPKKLSLTVADLVMMVGNGPGQFLGSKVISRVLTTRLV